MGDDNNTVDAVVEKLQTKSIDCIVINTVDDVAQDMKISGVIYLYTHPPQNFSSLQQWKSYTQRYHKFTFALFKAVKNLLTTDAVCCVATNSSLYANSALLKTIALEYPQLKVKSIYIKDKSPITDIIWREIANQDSLVEVIYNNKQRYRQKLCYTPCQPQKQDVEINTIVVSGGLRGITSKILQRIAVKGQKIIAIGRSQMPTPDQEEFAHIQDPEQLHRMMSKLHSQKTPREVNDDVQSLLNNRERYQTWKALEYLGVSVEYYSADVSNEVIFGSILEMIALKYPQIDLLIHAAGICKDNHINNKSAGEFAEVFDTKVDSLYLLEKYLALDNIPLLCFFSSGAAQFGNIGQADYAAANDFINHFCHSLNNKVKGRVIAFNWGPWAEIGMAAHLTNKFSQKRIAMIAPHEGVEFFVKELYYGQKHEVEIISGQESWTEELK